MQDMFRDCLPISDLAGGATSNGQAGTQQRISSNVNDQVLSTKVAADGARSHAANNAFETAGPPHLPLLAPPVSAALTDRSCAVAN